MKLTRFLFMILLFYQCELIEVPLEVEPAEDKMSLSSLLIGEEGVLVSVSKSFSALSGTSLAQIRENPIDALFVSRGNIQFQSNGNTILGEKFNDVPGFYFADFSDYSLGDSLEISVYDSVSTQQISARTKIMPSVNIDSIRFRYVAENTFLDTLKLFLTDPDTTQINYFVVHIYRSSSFLNILNNSDSLLVQSDSLLQIESIFSDIGIDSTLITRSYTIEKNPSNDTLIAVLSHIEEGYFRFLDARKRNEDGGGGIFNEPINFPSNVENGYGYFSAHNPVYKIAIRE